MLRGIFKRLGIATTALIFCVEVSHAMESQKFELHNLNDLLQKHDIQESLSSLVDFAIDAEGKKFAFLFIDNKYMYVDSIGIPRNQMARIYLNEKKIYDGGWSAECMPRSGSWFDMTKDGYVLFTPDCLSLYVNEKMVNVSRHAGRGLGSGYAYDNGKLVFLSGTEIKTGNILKDDDSIKEFTIANKKTRVLFRHRGKEINSLKVTNGNIAYIIKEGSKLIKTEDNPWPDTPLITWLDTKTYDSVWGVYLNGKKIKSNVVNPFLVLSSNKVPYTYENTKGKYVLYAGKKIYTTDIDVGGMVYEDDSKKIWHVDFQKNESGNIAGFTVLREKMAQKIPPNLLGLDMFTVSKNHYAFLGTLNSEGSLFQLVSDGMFMGEPLLLHVPSANKNDALFFGINEKIYMRAENRENKGIMTENGKPIFTKEFKDIFLIRKNLNGAIEVYGIQ